MEERWYHTIAQWMKGQRMCSNLDILRIVVEEKKPRKIHIRILTSSIRQCICAILLVHCTLCVSCEISIFKVQILFNAPARNQYTINCIYLINFKSFFLSFILSFIVEFHLNPELCRFSYPLESVY